MGLRALGVIARLDPVPHPLADQRSLEIRVRRLARIVERLRKLERPLDVLARCFEIPLAPVAARAPARMSARRKSHGSSDLSAKASASFKRLTAVAMLESL